MHDDGMSGIPLTARRMTAAALVVSGLFFTGAPRAVAQSAPDTENGRYSLSPSPEGFLRLDTRSGAVSTCTNKRGWACRLVPDERSALDTEIGRLQDENRQLKEQLAKRDAAAASVTTGKSDAPATGDSSKATDSKAAEPNAESRKEAEAKSAPPAKIELQLPPEHARLMALLDRVWGRLVEMAGQVQKRLSEKI